MSEDLRHNPQPWGSRMKLVLIGFSLIGGFFLIAEHRAHVLPYLPWLFLAACPLMHLFGHGGHGHGSHGGDARGGDRTAPDSAGNSPFGQQTTGALGKPDREPSEPKGRASFDHGHHHGEGQS